MTMGPVRYRAPRPGRRRWRTAMLLLVLLMLLSAATVAV